MFVYDKQCVPGERAKTEEIIMAMTKKPVTGMKDILPAEMQVRDYGDSF